MPYIPEPNPIQLSAMSEIKIKEQERIRERNLSLENTSDTAQSKRLSRTAYVLIQFAVIFLIILAIVIMYHLLH